MKNEELKEEIEVIDFEQEDMPEEPQKKKKKSTILYDLLIVAGIGMLILGGVLIYKDYSERNEEAEIYEDLGNQIVIQNPIVPDRQEKEDGTVTEVKKWAYQISVDLDALNEINKDVIGWIYFENETSISYPLMYSLDGDKYDRMLYNGVQANSGSIVLDATNNPDFTDQRNIIYGHNRADMSMFAKLKYYKNDGYWEDHPYFQIIHENGTVYRYEVFSYFDVLPTEVGTINNFFDEEHTYAECLEMLKSRSRRDHGVEVTEEDQIVTLVTCAYFGTQRFLVSAVLVDTYQLYEGEVNFNEDVSILPETETTTEETTETEDVTESESTTESEDGTETEGGSGAGNEGEAGGGSGSEGEGGAGSEGEAGGGSGTEGEAGDGSGSEGETGGESGAEGETGGGSGSEGETGSGSEGEAGDGSGSEGETGDGSGSEGETGDGSGSEGETGAGSGTEGEAEGDNVSGEDTAGDGTGDQSEGNTGTAEA